VVPQARLAAHLDFGALVAPEPDTDLIPLVITRVTPSSAKALLSLLRPRQWIKNGFVLAPLIFSGSFTRSGAVADALFATLLFCVASSAVYVLNDLMDLEADRRHPVKRETRPLAKGTVPVAWAKGLLVTLVFALLSGFAVLPAATLVILGYLLLNVAYSAKLKHLPVVDLFCIASGFVLRVQAGASATFVPLSSWMLITTLCLALYLAAVKRRDELASSGDVGRSVLGLYSTSLLDKYAERSAVGALVFYGLFVITVRPALVITIPLVIFGLFRYSYSVDRDGGESPTDAVWRDVPLALTVLTWAGLCAYTLWPH
jgi:4-hydroxybenzoate polyprenyltransferase